MVIIIELRRSPSFVFAVMSTDFFFFFLPIWSHARVIMGFDWRTMNEKQSWWFLEIVKDRWREEDFIKLEFSRIRRFAVNSLLIDLIYRCNMLFERNFVTIVNSINYRSVLLFFFFWKWTSNFFVIQII